MITASVVLYNTSKEEIDNVLGSLEGSSAELIYVIDHSDTEEARPTVEHYKKAHYEHHPNGGYGRGHNRAINKALAAGSKYHAVINPDVFWDGDVLSKLALFMDANSDCGLVMPRILFPDGEIQYLCKLLPTPMDLIGRRFIQIKSYTERHNYHYEMRWSGYDKVMDIPCLSGCFMFIRCDVLRQTGGFDERFFLYAEDIDLCRRIGEKSRTLYYPDVSVYHAYHRDSYKSLKYLRIHIHSIIKYFNKWGWFNDPERKKVNDRSLRLLQHKNK